MQYHAGVYTVKENNSPLDEEINPLMSAIWEKHERCDKKAVNMK